MRKHTLFKKILLAMLTLSLIPLLCSSSILFLNLSRTGEKLAERIAESTDLQASENLEMRARQTAEYITLFLKGCEADLLLVASLPHTPEILTSFYKSRNGEIWYRQGSAAAPREEKEWVPRYSSLEIIDKKGRQRFAIMDGRVVPGERLVDVSTPANTEFKNEQYFSRAARLKKRGIYVSRVTGFHITKDEQLAGATDPENAFGGKTFRGVIRFATPLFGKDGKFEGVAVLSLDHRHLMEFSQHILPGKERSTVFPSYKSGNYAFIFDDEGWIITHPKFWDIRGVYKTGKAVPPYTASSSADDVNQGRIPFNLDYAGFIHPQYPVVAQLAREKKGGYADITNVGGAKKVMAFAPILYSTGDYARHGIFGAVTIGFQVDQFHEAAKTGGGIISGQLRKHIRQSALFLFITALTVVLCAWYLSRGITRPLALLTAEARKLAHGETGNRVPVGSSDELGELADDFNKMAAELESRKESLLTTLEELQASQRQIMKERNFKERILESISSAILTISSDGLLTSINSTGKKFLGDDVLSGVHFSALFEGWGDMGERIARVIRKEKGYGREPLITEINGNARHFEVGFFPIGDDGDKGITVTMRDETEKEQMREEMIRMDRLVSLGKLSAGIAHEIRNPLTGISLLLDDLHDRPAVDSESQAMMGKALAEIERVERLISSLLNYASPPKAEFREGDINRVVQDTLLLFKKECEKQGVELVSSLQEIPSFPFDAGKIRQALLNISKNALGALPEGGKIEISTALAGDAAIINVSDNGQGIEPEDIPLLFEPFFTRKTGGTGLGLSITQRIIDEHHGRITVTSSKGNGTVFSVSLPLKTE